MSENIINSLSTVNYLELVAPDLQMPPDQYPFILACAHSSSPRFPIALEIIKKLPYKETISNRKPFYFVGFTHTPQHLKALATLIELVGGLKNSFLFADGKKIQFWQLKNILECYITSLEASNRKAYCWSYHKKSKADGLYGLSFTINLNTDKQSQNRNKEFEEYTFPCKHTDGFLYYNKKPAEVGMEDAYQAYIIQQPYVLCPHFQLQDFVYKERTEETIG